MKSIVKFCTAVAAGLVASTGVALANVDVPEPASLALAALGVAGVAFFARKGKK